MTVWVRERVEVWHVTRVGLLRSQGVVEGCGQLPKTLRLGLSRFFSQRDSWGYRRGVWVLISGTLASSETSPRYISTGPNMASAGHVVGTAIDLLAYYPVNRRKKAFLPKDF